MTHMKKNIFYFTPYYPPDNNAAAIRNYWFVKTLKEDEQNVQLVTGNDLLFKLPKNTDSAIKRLWKEQLAGIALFFKVLSSKHDLYFFSSPPFITILLGSLACRITKRRYILDIRDIYPEVFLHLGLLKEDSPIYKFILGLTKKMYKSADSIITVSKGLQNKIRNHSPESKVELIYNGYDSDLFKPNPNKFEKYTIVFHGNLGKFQRIDLLVEVARLMEKSHPDIQFKVIGYGPGEKHLQNPPSNLEYLGLMKYEDIASYIAKCHMGISLRTDDEISREALPVKVFEYIGVGIPVIVTPQGEASELVENKKLGSTAKNKAQKIIQKILETKRINIGSVDNFSRQAQSQKVTSIII